jgi:hypothetical protein
MSTTEMFPNFCRHQSLHQDLVANLKLMTKEQEMVVVMVLLVLLSLLTLMMMMMQMTTTTMY